LSGAIEQRLHVLEVRVAALEARAAGGGSSLASGGGQSNGGGEVADDYDLDGKFGDPVVTKAPKKWIENGGAEYSGHMSGLPSDFLLAVADFYDWQARMDDKEGKAGKTYRDKKTGEEKPVTGFLKRRDAARARGWAKRNAGAQSAPQSPPARATTQPRQAVPQGPQKPVQDDYGDTPYDDDGSIPF
jgi:hypothetical protein